MIQHPFNFGGVSALKKIFLYMIRSQEKEQENQ